MNDTFPRAVEFVLAHEGGYTNDPDDPGGETNFGISKRAYPDEDIKAMTRTRAIEIYKKDYWDRMDCDVMSYPLDWAVFDAAVNCGRGRVSGWLDQTHHFEVFMFLRLKHYVGLTGMRKYLGGWTQRVVDLFFATYS